MKHKRKVTLSLAAALALTLSGAIAAIAPADVAAEENATNKQTFDFTKATSFDELSMFSVGVDPETNNDVYTQDSCVTYAKTMDEAFDLDGGLKVDTSIYSGDASWNNRIYVRYNAKTLQYFEAEMTYSYTDTAKWGWAGFMFGYTNYERQARWGDSPNGAEFFVQNEGKGTYAGSKFTAHEWNEGATPENWTMRDADHTLSIVVNGDGITFKADGTVVNTLSKADLEGYNYEITDASVGFMLTNAQFTVKSFSVTDLHTACVDTDNDTCCDICGKLIEQTYLKSFDFTSASDFNAVDMFSVGIDPQGNSDALGYTGDSGVTYARDLDDIFTLTEKGLQIKTSAYVGDDVSENNIYVRYNEKELQYFKAELKYSYDDASRNGWAGFILGYTNYERKARWGDSPNGLELFVQREGKGTYSSAKLNNAGYTEGDTPANWKAVGEHTLTVIAVKSNITLYADGVKVISISEEEMQAKGFERSFASIGFVLSNAQFTAKSFKVTDLSMAVKAQTNSDQNAIRFVSAVDSLDYAKVGFEISVDVNGTTKTVTVETTKVYTSLLANGTKFYSTEFGVEDGYLFAYTVTGVPSADTQFTVRAYVVTNDGETVYGEANVLKISDANA